MLSVRYAVVILACTAVLAAPTAADARTIATGTTPAYGSGRMIAFLASESTLRVFDVVSRTALTVPLEGQACRLAGAAAGRSVVSCLIRTGDVWAWHHSVVTLRTGDRWPLPGAPTSRELESPTEMGARWVRGTYCIGRCAERLVDWRTGATGDLPIDDPLLSNRPIRPVNLDTADPATPPHGVLRRDIEDTSGHRPGPIVLRPWRGRDRVLDRCRATVCGTPVTAGPWSGWLRGSARDGGHTEVRWWSKRTGRVRTLRGCGNRGFRAIAIAGERAVVSRLVRTSSETTPATFAYCALTSS